MPHPALKDVFSTLRTRMEKAVEDFRREMAATRTGRANVHMLDTVSVDYYGSQMPVNQIAQIHAPEPQMITVQPFDASQLGVNEKAIRGADLGLKPKKKKCWSSSRLSHKWFWEGLGFSRAARSQ